MTLIQRSSLPAKDVVAQLKEAFHPSRLVPRKAFPGIDPSELEAFSQEYERSLAALLSELEHAVLGQMN
ncbi:MAG TPA: hypothetical protein VE029_03035 [Rhizobacter sp.]|nr:hypothetical protein [Rhizobacter sp.]